MKGVILAGGSGSRLEKLTSVVNKHLAPVGDVPMIEYPLATLRQLEPSGIIVVSGQEHLGTLVQYLTQEYSSLDFTYKVQKEAGGIAQALSLVKDVSRDFNGGKKLAVILGDNIYDADFSEAAGNFEYREDYGCMLFLKKVEDPERFGVAEIKNGKIVSLEEKPKKPRSDLAVTGLYFYDHTLFDKISALHPSPRGEYEITDVNRAYIEEGKATFIVLDTHVFWSDAGTPESRARATAYVQTVPERFKIISKKSKFHEEQGNHHKQKERIIELERQVENLLKPDTEGQEYRDGISS